MSSLSKSLRLSSSMEEEMMMVPKKQGIVSILGCDVERTISAAASLRRTLSADMSSKKWQAQHGFYLLKKIASSDHFPACDSITDSSEDEDFEDRPKETETRDQFDIWSSIQEDKNKKEVEKPGQFDVWSSILSQKTKEDSKNVQPYVHPLVKRSASSLSEKSLEICTESLGSETGCDGFSSYPPSEIGDAEEEKEEEQRQERVTEKFDMEDLRAAKYNLAASNSKKSQPRSFPPPIPSLSSRDGASVHMRSRRDNGRLVLEVVSVPSQNNFHAQRQDGRLVLTLANTASQEDEERQKNEEMSDVEQFDVEIENSEGREEVEEEIEEGEVEDGEDKRGGGGRGVRFVMGETPKLSSGILSVHRLALMMNKSLVLANRNPAWPNKFEDMTKFGDEVELADPITPITQSLPQRRPPATRLIPSPPVATMEAAAATAKAAASFNACEYFWKPKPMTTSSVINPVSQKQASSLGTTHDNISALSKKFVPNEQQEVVVLRGNNGDYLVPLLKSCKEQRKSLLFWEPHCIATS
ncbi:PREDICTED: protein FAF-like, chloroplastic [Populus euphratica]|uniref:Protein FAF-like, chloroplastic n=1 Tax=Populus euphratica TaxID=75702 RepID=A0AAJ6X7Z7_POPEU|nr:PREDICTED: protein FAF-like, chloroplastic [Populus euphratica]